MFWPQERLLWQLDEEVFISVMDRTLEGLLTDVGAAGIGV